jgi:hypothetical protein
MRTPGRTAAITAAIAFGTMTIAPGAVAEAEEPAPALAAAETAFGTVTLPTGDRVTLDLDGTLAIEPAEGREDIGFVTPTALDGSGEVIAVPTDRVDDIQAGLEDPRRYNVTKLLEAGLADAAAAPESALDQREYEGLRPEAGVDATAAEAETEQFSVVLRDRTGNVPDGEFVEWAKRDGGASGIFEIDDTGVGTAALEAGEYVIVSGFWNDPSDTERGEMVVGLTPVTVGEGPDELVLDAAAARPVSVEVEREGAVPLGAVMTVRAQAADFPLGFGDYVPAESDSYLLPEPDLPEFEVGFIYQTTLTSPAGEDEPYTYNLALGSDDGYPEDTAFTVADAELAQVETHFLGFGVPVSGRTCDYGDFASGRVGFGLCLSAPVEHPSVRTMLYSAGPDLLWAHDVEGGVYDEEGEGMLEGFGAFVIDVAHEPGPAERTVPHGPVSTGAPATLRYRDGETLLFSSDLFPGSNTTASELLMLYGYDGKVTLSRDGEVLGESDEVRRFEFPVTDEPGRYTLESEASHSGTSGLFGTVSRQSWSFDVGAMPEEGVDWLHLPVVAMALEGAEGGRVDGDEPIAITLQAVAGAPAGPVDVAKMTFEVSYNDGRSWRKVRLDRDGGTATAALCAPWWAEFVSVRMTATDTNGTEVVHTTIRSFGLD